MKVIIDNKLSDITPRIAAEVFCNMNSEEQASFFNHIAEIASKWSNDFNFQLQFITEENGLTLAGRRVMQSIGDYSHWGLSCNLTKETSK